MIIDCISDLHGYYPKLEGGDLLIVAGDLTASDKVEQHSELGCWLKDLDYKKIICISGNHDNWFSTYYGRTGLDSIPPPFFSFTRDPENKIEYLCDSGTEFEGLRIWGSPWSLTFPGMNPHCKAFTVDTEEELAEKWALIPDDVDILITHTPPYGVLDDVEYRGNGEDVHKGSNSLIMPLVQSKCRLHVFGHIHEAYGKYKNPINGITYVNASHVNEYYKPINKPIRVIL